jgi:uncharacterized protein involved in exopolysaccharide biosynthesis
VLVFTLLGVTYALLAPEEYTSEARVVREAQSESGGSLPGGISPGALSGFGISLGGSASGLTPAAYPDVLQSREVQLSVVRDTFRFPDAERPMTFVEHVNRPPGVVGRLLDYTIWLPWTLKKAVGDFIANPTRPTDPTGAGKAVIRSEEEDDALDVISGMISTSVDEETGLMNISVTAEKPVVASKLTESFLTHLRTRIQEIRTEKVSERLKFVEKRFLDAEEELETTEEQLAKFLERNQNPTTATLQFRRDRLRRQVSFKEQLYSELQSQLTQTRLDLQRRKPVVTIVEGAALPTEPSDLGLSVILVLSIALGVGFGAVIALLKNSVEGSTKGEIERVIEIKELITPNILKGYKS